MKIGALPPGHCSRHEPFVQSGSPLPECIRPFLTDLSLQSQFLEPVPNSSTTWPQAPLCFHNLTHRSFRNSFSLIIMQIAGGVIPLCANSRIVNPAQHPQRFRLSALDIRLLPTAIMTAPAKKSTLPATRPVLTGAGCTCSPQGKKTGLYLQPAGKKSAYLLVPRYEGPPA
jgi:hypothetical protein